MSAEGSVRTELIEDEGESRYKITDIIGENSRVKDDMSCIVVCVCGVWCREEGWDWSREPASLRDDRRGNLTGLRGSPHN